MATKKKAALTAVLGSMLMFGGCGINIEKLLLDATIEVIAEQLANFVPTLGGDGDGNGTAQ